MKALDEGASHASGGVDEADGEDQNMAEISKLRQQSVEDRQQKVRDVINHRQALLKELYFMMHHADDADGLMKPAPGELEVNEKEFRKFEQRYPLPMNEEISKAAASMEVSTFGEAESREPMDVTQDGIEAVIPDGAVECRPVACEEVQHQLEKDSEEELDVIPPKRPPERTAVAEQPPVKRTAYGLALPLPRKNGFQNLAEGDELTPLDVYTWQLRVQDKLLFKLVRSANKAVLTNDWQASRREAKSVRALQRMDVLKMSNHWPFRQLRKHASTPRTKTHWDFLLEEMRWLRTDFREERKWKIATAFKIGQAVLEWHAAEDKSEVCVKRRVTSQGQPKVVRGDQVMVDGNTQAAVTGLRSGVAGGPDEPSKERHRLSPGPTNKKEFDPLLSLTPDTTFVREDGDWAPFFASYPLYEPPSPDDKEAYLDEAESGRVTVVSRLMTKKFKVGLAEHSGQQKVLKGRADRGGLCRDPDIPPWLDTAQEVGSVLVVVEPTPSKGPKSRPTADLFARPPDASYKATRPPKPPAKPSYRLDKNAAVWTDEEEDMLLHLAQLYQQNWDLIADIFNAQKALFTSPTREQRTPYDCYEKWVKQTQAAATTAGNQKDAQPSSRARSSSSSAGMPNRTVKFSPAKGRKTLGIVEAMKRVADRREMANMPASPRESAGDEAGLVTPRAGFGSARYTPLSASGSGPAARSPSVGIGSAPRQATSGGSPAPEVKPASTPAAGSTIEIPPGQSGANPAQAAESRVFSPFELSMVKAEKERQMSRAFLAQQQQQAAVHYARQGNFRQAVPVISWSHQFVPGLPNSPAPALQKQPQPQQQQHHHHHHHQTQLFQGLQVPVASQALRQPFTGANSLPAATSPQPDFMMIPHVPNGQPAPAGASPSQGQQLTLTRPDAALQHQRQQLHQQLVHQQFLQRRSAAIAQQQVIARLQQQLHHQQPQIAQQGIQQLQNQQLHHLPQPQAQQLQQFQQQRAAMLRQQQEQRAAAFERLRQSGFLQRVQQMVTEGRITQEQAQQAISTRLHVGHASATSLGVPVGYQGSQSPQMPASELSGSTSTSPPSEVLHTPNPNDRVFYHPQ